MKKIILLTSISLSLLSACGADSSDNSKFDELNNNRLKWEALNETDYETTFVYSAFSLDAATYKTYVEQERVLTVLRDPNNAQDSEYKLPDHFLFDVASVANLFDIAENAIAVADDYTIVYNDELGYPTRISIDYSSTLGDDEVEYRITELVRGSQTACANIARPGISVNLALENDTAVDICDAQIVLEDGDFIEQVTDCSNNTFDGAIERIGNYTITASYPEHTSQTIENIMVYPFLCGVGTRNIDITLSTLAQ